MDSRDEAEPGNVESAGSDAGITIIQEPPQPPLATLQVQSDSAEPQPLQTTPESRRRSSFSFLSIFPSTTTKEGTTSNNTEQTTPEIPQPFSFMTRKSSLKDPSNLFERVHRASILGVPQLAAVKAMATLKLGAASNSKDEPAEPQTHNGWSGPKYGAADVTVRTKGRRTVYLLKAADVILFDRIAKWKTPKNTVEDAWNVFGSGALIYGHTASSPDAFIKLHFGVLRYDYILKCVCTPGDSKGDALRKRFETKLLQKGLIIEREISLETPNEVFIKIITPFSALCAEAQLMKLKLPLKTDTNYNSRLSVASAGAKTIPSYLNGSIRYLKRLFMLDDLDTKTQSAAFKRKDLTRFKGGDPKDIDPCTIQLEFFRDSHRSLLTFNIISHVEISMQVAGLVAKHKDRKGIDYLLSEGIYTAMFHLHDNENDPDTMREYLRREWVQKYFEIQPIDDIAAYFGETVGLYFAFIGFYNVWLLISTGLGLIVVLHGLTQAFTSDGGFQWHILFDNDLTPFFGLFISLWAILMPIAWDRQTKFFAWRWSTTDYQKEETKRPQYKGELQRRSPITGKMELVFPAKRRTRRQLISSVVILFWILIVSSSIAVQVSIGAYLSPKVNNDIAINVITSLLGLTSIVIMKIPFGAIVEKLNEWENYRTKSQFNDALIFKTYIFDFANSYSQLIYYAFVKPNLSYYYLFGMEELNEYCTKEQCASSVTINLFVIFIGGQIIERFQELAIPLIVAKSKQMLSVFRLKSRRSKMMRKKTIRPEETTQSNDTIILASVVGKSEHSLAPSATSTIDHKPSPITFQYPPPRSRKSTLAIAPVDTPSIRLEAPEITHSMTTANSLPAFQSVEQLNTHLNPSHAGSRNVSIISDKTEKSKSRTGSIMSQSSALSNIRNSTAVPRSSVMLPLASHRPSMSTYDDQYVIDLAEAELLPQYYRDDKLNAFGGIRDEYATKIIQFGYIALFACSFPLAPLFALINNIYEIRADAFKLLVVYQRPEPFLAQDIGVWGMIIRVIAITSVATNSVLVSFTSPTFDTFFIKGLSMGEQMAIRLGFVIVFHYIVFALTQVFQLLMPNTPSIVTTAMARAQYLEKVKMDQDLEEEDEFFNQESRDSLC